MPKENLIKSAEANGLLLAALQRMAKAAKEADAAGRQYEASDIRRELAAIKMSLAERDYAAANQVSHYGPGVRRLFAKGTSPAGVLADDPHVLGF
jgi:hypothetical protein